MIQNDTLKPFVGIPKNVRKRKRKPFVIEHEIIQIILILGNQEDFYRLERDLNKQ